VLAFGCGGSKFTSGNGANSDDGGGSTNDGSSGDNGGSDASTNDGGIVLDGAVGDSGLVAQCAATPSAGAACSPTGLQCEYGTDPNVGCNTVEECKTGQGFQPVTFSATPKDCPTPTHATENKCPATYQLVPSGATCNDDGLECAYPEGICACTRGSGPITNVSNWACPSPANGCPKVRPHVGSPCPSNLQVCNYGECTYRGGVNLRCEGGAWIHIATTCPA
jgi:hypothetical protein